MIEFEYEKIAMIGGEMPQDMDSCDQTNFLKLRLLYDSYKKGILTRERAKAEKAKIIKEYELDRNLNELDIRWVTLLKETEKARIEYRKNRTLENADKLMEIIEGITIK